MGSVFPPAWRGAGRRLARSLLLGAAAVSLTVFAGADVAAASTTVPAAPRGGATDTSNGHGPFFVSWPDHFLHIGDGNIGSGGGTPYQVTGADSAVERITDHAAVGDITLQGVLEALADPVRRSIVRQLADAERDMACGTFDINVTRSTSTHHFKVLRHAGIIWQHYDGTVKLNRLRREDLERAVPGVLEAIIECARSEAA